MLFFYTGACSTLGRSDERASASHTGSLSLSTGPGLLLHNPHRWESSPAAPRLSRTARKCGKRRAFPAPTAGMIPQSILETHHCLLMVVREAVSPTRTMAKSERGERVCVKKARAGWQPRVAPPRNILFKHVVLLSVRLHELSSGKRRSHRHKWLDVKRQFGQTNNNLKKHLG